MRELQEYSQNELARATGTPQSTISGIESGRINLGVERAKVLRARSRFIRLATPCKRGVIEFRQV